MGGSGRSVSLLGLRGAGFGKSECLDRQMVRKALSVCCLSVVCLSDF